MEPHATIAVWEGDKLTVYDATQGIFGARKRAGQDVRPAAGERPRRVALPRRRLRLQRLRLVACRRWPPWPPGRSGRPVKLVLTRQQMFGPVGYRPRTEQKLQLGAAKDGTLTGRAARKPLADLHVRRVRRAVGAGDAHPLRLPERPRPRTGWCGWTPARRLSCARRASRRAPFALESAMDELAYALNMDPIALRLKNYAETDPEEGKPWSSKSLRACYQTASEKFGWARRTPAPGSMKADDGKLIGWGMATATYPIRRSAVVRPGPPAAGRHGLCPGGDAGPGHGHLHRHDPDRRRRAGPAAVQGAVRAGRHADARNAGLRRLADGGQHRLRRPAPPSLAAKSQAIELGDRRRRLAAARADRGRRRRSRTGRCSPKPTRPRARPMPT